MNRAERRRLEKHGSVYGEIPTLTPEVVLDYNCCAFVVSMDAEGIDRETIKKVLNRVSFTMQCLRCGHVDICDLKEMCSEQVGINMHRK